MDDFPVLAGLLGYLDSTQEVHKRCNGRFGHLSTVDKFSNYQKVA